MSIEALFNELSKMGWRGTVGHQPHWYTRKELPKHLRRRPFEAYVVNDEPLGSRFYVNVSADGETAFEALHSAYDGALKKDKAQRDEFEEEKRKEKEEKERKKREAASAAAAGIEIKKGK